MKYYAKEDIDGNKIIEYVDEAINKNEKPDELKIIKFGNTTVGFGENENTKEADIIIKLDNLMFGKITMKEEGDVIVVDIGDAEVPRYEHPLGRIRIDRIGSSPNSMLGTREKGSSYDEDITLFNKALDGGGWALGKYGSLGWASEKYDDPNAKYSMPGPIGMTMNVFMESLKYYSSPNKNENGVSDGEAIYAFVDKAVKEMTEIATGETYQFGNTKIKITDPGVFGIDIIFLGYIIAPYGINHKGRL